MSYVAPHNPSDRTLLTYLPHLPCLPCQPYLPYLPYLPYFVQSPSRLPSYLMVIAIG